MAAANASLGDLRTWTHHVFLLFQSPNSPTVPQEKIHHITTMYPEDPRAPFYDPSGKPMLPLARLYLTRNAVIPKSCDEQSLDRILEEAVQVAENTEDTSRRESCQQTRRKLSIIQLFTQEYYNDIVIVIVIYFAFHILLCRHGISQSIYRVFHDLRA